MKLLRDFPSLRLSLDESRDPRKSAGFSEAPTVHWRRAATSAQSLAAETGVDTLVVIEPHVSPSADSEVVAVDQVLSNSNEVIRYPAKSVVTGLHLQRGLLLVPVQALNHSTQTLPPARLTAPHSIGVFEGNGTPELAFEMGFVTVSGQPRLSPDCANRVALSASLGTDALNGPWWVLGSLAGLLGNESLGEAWVRHEELLSNPRDIHRHILGEARRVRLSTGLPVQALSQEQSRSMKAMLPDWPAADVWEDFIAGCKTLGPDGEVLADRYRSAARYIWPGAI